MRSLDALNRRNGLRCPTGNGGKIGRLHDRRRGPSALGRRAAAALIGLCLFGGGCSALKVPFMDSIIPAKEEPVAAPQSLAVVWSNAVLETQGQPATRGFGGLVTFHGADQKRPIRVEGQLTVYAYEETSRRSGGAAPDRKYVFTPEQFAKHYGNGSLGPSYSIWIPWDKIGGERRDISLVTRFDAVDGGVVMSKPTRVVLPGKSAPPVGGGEDMAAGVPQAAAKPETMKPAEVELKDGENSSCQPKRQMITTTLDLPSKN